jgi:orotate phosphoribosyltransferase
MYKTQSINDKNNKNVLLKYIIENAVTRGNITLSSGKKSDLYIDMRLITLSSRGSFLISDVLFDMLKDTDFDAIGGMTMGADPIVGSFAAVSYLKNKPVDSFIIRKESKGHGKKKRIEGPLKDGAKVVIVDDVSTTGGSILQSIDVIEQSTNCEIVKVVSLVDRLEGAGKSLAERGYDLCSIFDRNDIINY